MRQWTKNKPSMFVIEEWDKLDFNSVMVELRKLLAPDRLLLGFGEVVKYRKKLIFPISIANN